MAVGVTDTIAETGEAPVFTPVKPGVSPDPVAERPTEVFVFVQLNVVPAMVLEKAEAAMAELWQTVTFVGVNIDGIGFTVILDKAVSLQPLPSE